jgi:flagellar hook-length control protein FliK
MEPDSATPTLALVKAGTDLGSAGLSADHRAASPPTTAPPREAPPPAAMLVSRGLAAAAAHKGGVVHVRLVPESLGEVRLHMKIDAGAVSVRIEAATPAAQGLLSDHLGVLRASLEARGLAVDRLAVHLAPAQAANSGPASGNQGGSAEPGPGGAWNGAEHDAGGSPSRGRSDEHAAHGRAAPANPDDTPDRGAAPADRSAFGQRLRLRLSAVA